MTLECELPEEDELDWVDGEGVDEEEGHVLLGRLAEEAVPVRRRLQQLIVQLVEAVGTRLGGIRGVGGCSGRDGCWAGGGGGGEGIGA